MKHFTNKDFDSRLQQILDFYISFLSYKKNTVTGVLKIIYFFDLN